MPKKKHIPPVRAEVSDISRPNTDAVVCAANTTCVMRDNTARKIFEAAGEDIQKQLKEVRYKRDRPIEIGESLVTDPFEMRKRGVLQVYHAIITPLPRGLANINAVNHSVRNALRQAIEAEMTSIAIPALGVGGGRLDATVVAGVLLPIANNVQHNIKVRFVDQNEDFINAINKQLRQAR